jgi:hypothetical protein
MSNHAQMKTHWTQLKQRPVKALAVVGVGAVVTLGALSAAYGGIEIRPGPLLARSGHEHNPVPTQPAVGQMDLGATEMPTTPSAEPQVTIARPPVRAH